MEPLTERNRQLRTGCRALHTPYCYRCSLPGLAGFTVVRRSVGVTLRMGCIREAERVGFEPTLRFRKHAFQACAFNHSATSPGGRLRGHVAGDVAVGEPAAPAGWLDLQVGGTAEREGFEPPVLSYT